MSNAVLILGESGTGKSSAIRTLPPEQTFILNVIGKNLPFRGAQKNYTLLSSDGLTGNYYCSDNPAQIKRVINLINAKRPEFKYFVIDDAGYIIMNQFMKRCLDKGFEKFVTLGKDFSDILDAVKELRSDLYCFLMMHVEADQAGKTKPKTIGKMIDQHICIEGNFTYVLHTSVYDGHYRFITNNDNYHMCKTPMGLFDQHIDNDLLLVATKIHEYNNTDINQ